MKTAEWIALAAAVVAMASAVWAERSAGRAAAAQGHAEHYHAKGERNAQHAIWAAEDAAVAQLHSEEAAARAAEAADQQNRMNELRADLAEGVPWRIAYQISGAGVLRQKAVDRIDGCGSASFVGLNAMGVGDRVDVTWHRQKDRSDTPRHWSGDKPPGR